MQDRIQGLCEELERHGFDLHAQGDPRELSQELQACLTSAFPGWGGGAPNGDSILLTGNTRVLWEPLLAAAPSLPAEDPLDTYCERVHVAAARRWLPGARLWFAHQVDPALPFQRLGAALGLFEIGPAGLGVHAVYGPWFGLRALLLVPRGNISSTRVATPERRLGAGTDAQSALLPPAPAASHCTGCTAPCVPPFRAALDASRQEPLGRSLVARHFETWLAVRDACPVGRAHRYGSAQLRFHYGVEALPRSGGRPE